eukprot:434989-Pelagomonas_calceolata.AAC.4
MHATRLKRGGRDETLEDGALKECMQGGSSCHHVLVLCRLVHVMVDTWARNTVLFVAGAWYHGATKTGAEYVYPEACITLDSWSSILLQQLQESPSLDLTLALNWFPVADGGVDENLYQQYWCDLAFECNAWGAYCSKVSPNVNVLGIIQVRGSRTAGRAARRALGVMLFVLSIIQVRGNKRAECAERPVLSIILDVRHFCT